MLTVAWFAGFACGTRLWEKFAMSFWQFWRLPLWPICAMVLLAFNGGISLPFVPQATAHNQFERQHVQRIFFYGVGRGGEPLSHCKLLVRWPETGQREEFFLEDDECEQYRGNEWFHPPRVQVRGFFVSEHFVMPIEFFFNDGPYEVMFVPQNAT